MNSKIKSSQKNSSSLKRSQIAINKMFNYWNRKTDYSRTRSQRLDYYHALGKMQDRQNRKLTNSERKKLYSQINMGRSILSLKELETEVLGKRKRR